DADIGAVFGHHTGVHGGDPAVGTEPDLDAALESGAAAADGIFLVPGNAHHHRTVDLARHMRRNRHFRIGIALGAKPATAIFRDENEIFGLDAAIACQTWNGIRLALRGAEHEHLAVLPIGHSRARLHAMMALRADN